MSKKVVYRFVDSDGSDRQAPIIFTEGGKGSTTEMDIVQARNGMPETIQRDQIVFNREDSAFYVGQADGTPKRVTDIDVLERFAELPKAGVEGRLYISLKENIFSVWKDGKWSSCSLSPVSVVQCYGVTSYKTKKDFPPTGEENHIYMTQDGSGYQYDSFNGYTQVFGDKTWTWTKDEADARFAFKSDIPVIPSLSDLGGITPHDVDAKIQDAKDEAAQKYATLSDNDLKANASEVYSKTDADNRFLDKKSVPTLSSLGALSTAQADVTYAKKANLDTLSQNVDKIQDRVNTLSEYSKTTEMQKAVNDSAASIRDDLKAYAKSDDMDKRLAEKADNVSVVKKTDMVAYALKGDIPTLDKLGGVSRTEIENTYATKTNIQALDKNIKDGYYPKTDIDTKLADVYTKADADAKIKAALPAEPWTDFAKKSDLTKDFAVKSETYTKDELEKRLKSIETHGVDLSGYLKENDDPSDKYLDDRIDKKLPDMTKYAAKDGLLKELIQQDKAKGSDLLLDYFVNQGELQDIKLGMAETVTEHGNLEVTKDGKQLIALKEPVTDHPELPAGHNPIKLFVNGVRYIEGVDFSYDKTSNQIEWIHTEEDGYFRLTKEDELRIEHDTPVSKKYAPPAASSSADPNAPVVAIDKNDLKTIQDCTTRSETAATNAKAAKDSIDASEKHVAELEKQASDIADNLKKDRQTLDTNVATAQKTSDDAKKAAEIATPVTLLKTMLASSWKDNKSAVYDGEIKSNSVIFLDLQTSADDEMKQAFDAAGIISCAQWDGGITLQATETPAIDLDVRLFVMGGI